MPSTTPQGENNGFFVNSDALRISMGLPVMNKNSCKNCGKKILVSIFIGGDWCSDNCRKALGKDLK